MTCRINVAETSNPTFYLDGAEFAEHLTGVFFALLPTQNGFHCTGVHAESADHMHQYDEDARASFFARAAVTASNDNATIYDADGQIALQG